MECNEGYSGNYKKNPGEFKFETFRVFSLTHCYLFTSFILPESQHEKWLEQITYERLSLRFQVNGFSTFTFTFLRNIWKSAEFHFSTWFCYFREIPVKQDFIISAKVEVFWKNEFFFHDHFWMNLKNMKPMYLKAATN